MAPLKRTRRIAEDDDDDDGDLGDDSREQSLSVSEAQLRKRVRLSLDQRPLPESDSSSSDSDDGDSDDGDSDDSDHGSPPQTQYEIMRDAGFRHLENTHMDDLRATQKLKHRPTASLGNNMAAESGIIESITCINFMCHQRLHVELGPLINFIVGENGSGKSAVLTALTLCLGGKASDTNRGGSLKSFIKEGQEHARLIVKIKNAGSDAYQHDVYGNSIIVERHFTRSGSSGFKIRSEHEQVISTKKQEVDEISEWYALQMGNPLTVLSQDNARQFLNSATPAQKYKYFVSGVQLEQLDNDYKMSQDTLDKTLILRDDLNEKIGHVKKTMEDAQRLAETIQKNHTLREKARHYRNQLVWSQVVEQEQDLERRNRDLESRDESIAKAMAECEEFSKALTSAEDKLAKAEENRTNHLNGKGSIDERVAAAVMAYEAAKKDQTELIREERDAYGRLKAAKTEVAACEAKIQEEVQRLSESTGSARASKDAELSEARSREERINEDMSEKNRQLPALLSRLVSAQEGQKRQTQLKQAKSKDIVAAQTGVQELERDNGSDVYAGFDREIINLVKKVADDRGFEIKPIGPLGAHIRLLKPEWSSILEKTLGDTLNAFVVRSKRDQTRLSGLIRQVSMRKPPPIYIAYGGSIDTRAQEPDSRFDTMLRVLKFDNDLVRSQLVINNQIEKIILVPDRKEAERIMIDEGPPRNVGACICFHDGAGKRGYGLRITNRSGAIGTSPVIPIQGRSRMQSDSARQLAIQKENLKQLGLEMRDLNSEERIARQAVQRYESEIDTQKEQLTQLGNELRRTRADIERIQTELDAFEGVDGRLMILRAELETKRADVENIGNQYGNMTLTKRELSAKVEELKGKLDAEQGQDKDFQARLEKLEGSIKKCQNMRRMALAEKNNAYENLDIGRAERQRAQMRRDEKAKEVEDFIRQAEEAAPGRVHIPEGEDYRSIERKYDKIKEQLSQREARIGATDQQIFDRATEARARYEDVVKQTQQVDETIASLKRAIEHRLHLWRQFQRQISARVRIQFNYLLSERGFRGKIDLDHRARKVNIHIEPDETRKSSAGRNTKTLSGGEKSFSSICMLLSVWEAIGSPIRCLDEFDVFMDNVNRAISTNMLVDAARRSVSRQYILITPNAIEGRARLDKDVTIIRLASSKPMTRRSHS
ncbi:hypothetical protein HIM_08181 [Hirsutella minnesotensis 3608]|uniref:RecF/RecN/SMC N-terminal domain-containing protein n=1 Tax=Hirsutella minnesotensis 3608 TaxID=1043627 RepID=A0A0F7ZT26_9HYPO|nr:hypothetical protein HIM_08181 [Hirsutella minnesotensis 3608]